MSLEDRAPQLNTQDLHEELAQLRDALLQSQQVEAELDRRMFHLKTLYDVSKDLFGSIEPETILKNGLLMAMGNFGVAEGFAALADPLTGAVRQTVSVGFKPADALHLENTLKRTPPGAGGPNRVPAAKTHLPCGDLPAAVDLLVPFEVQSDCAGILALGKKLVGVTYSENDRELLETLANNLAVAVRNARSFAKIKGLNVELEGKNRKLKHALKELKSALHKIEVLECIKSNLSKFVPAGVTRLVERTPTGEIIEARELDVTVLFLDIEGYTRLTEQIGATQVNALTERYFSVFMDAIFANNGDVVETAGDGLMVLFLNDEGRQHALEAVQAAQTIMAKTCLVNNECRLDAQPVVINIGICSGPAFVGASKFESLAGGRWAYTSHGTTVNVAARLCSQATGGAVLVSRSTAERVEGRVALKKVGCLALKNLSDEVEVFTLEEPR